MSSRNLAALAVAVVAGVAGGVYTFGPMLKEQQKAQEAWKNPGPAQTDVVPQKQGVKTPDQTTQQSPDATQGK